MASSKRNHEPNPKEHAVSQAKAFALNRGDYSSILFQTIFAHHSGTGGAFTRALDVGCGTGNATRDVSAMFDETVGIDASLEMINVARKSGGVSRTGKPIVFTVTSAEDVGLLEEESMDLVTVAMAAHWFDMNVFWPSVANVLKPNGTVALWNVYSMFCHPSTPNSDAIQKILQKFEHEILRPYSGNETLLALGGYEDLPMPWSIASPDSSFDKSSFVRKEWNKDGKISKNEGYIAGQREVSLEELGKSLETASAVSRWRQKNPELSNSPKDAVKELIAKIGSLLPAGAQKLVIGGSTALLMVKKRSIS